MIKRTLLILFLILALLHGKAQDLIFNHLVAKNGLSQNSIFAIVQDNRGFMWYGSRFGLNRYDGSRFALYRSSATDSSTITDDYITSLASDSKGTLWVGTANGLNKFNPQLNTFDRIKLSTSQASHSYDMIRQISEDKKGRLWIATNKGLFMLSSRENNSFLNAAKFGLPKSIANSEILSAYQDEDGYIWIGTNNGLVRFLFNTKIYAVKIFKNDHTPGSISGNAVTGIVEDRHKNLWFATENNGLNLFHKATETFSRFVHEEGNANSLVHNAIRTLEINTSGDLWIGTQEGLSILNPDSKVFRTFQHRKANQKGLNQNSIYSIYEDRNGSVWIGTYYGGVNVTYANPTNFKNWQYNEKQPGISHNVVSSIIAADGNNLWIGTEGGGLNYYDSSSGKFKVYNYQAKNQESLGSDLVKVLYKDQNQNVWIGTHGGGLNVLDHQTQKFKRFLTLKNDFNTTRSEIVALLEDSYGWFWIGSQTGLSICNKVNTELTPLKNNGILKIFDDKNIKVLFEDSKQQVWIVATSGLYVYTRQTNSLKSFKLPKGSNSVSSNSNYINCIQEDSKGNIWIGLYYGGLACFNPKTKSFAPPYTTKDGLSNNNVLGILEDTKQQLWVSTSNGLNKFDPVQKTFQTYTVSDGLAGDEFNYNSFFVNKNGEMFFGGYNGLTHFFPNQIPKNSYKAPIVFTRLRLFDVPVKINTPDQLLQQDIGYTKKLVFNYDQNIFTIEFALLNYIKSNKNRYAYKLEGINERWVESSIPTAAYTNLPSGSYKLLVKGANNDGVWSEPAVMQIEILPPFWKTWWAFCFYTFILGAIIFFIIRFFYLRELLIKDEELHQVKLNFFTNVSHEIRTHLTLIMAPIDKLLDEHKSGAINKQLINVKNNADRLLKLVSELMDFRKAETKHLKLHVGSHDLAGFLDSIFASFEELSRQKNITFTIVHANEPITVYFDKEQMEKVFFNLISNAFKFTPHGRSITVKTEKLHNSVKVSVIDTGRGIAAEHLEKLFSNFFQVDDHHIQNTGYGIGLALAKNIIELHKGDIQITSEPAKGNEPGYTNFTVTLLLGHQHFKQALLIQQPSDATKSISNNLHLPTQTATTSPPEHTGSKQTILVIDDNADIRALLKESLTADYRVLIAKDGFEGWNKAAEEIPDLIISDVMMPKIDGVLLCNRLKTDERTSHIPVILLTAKSSETDQIEGLTGGADSYLTKPFSHKILQLHVRNLLNGRETMRNKFSRSLLLAPHEVAVNPVDEQFLSKLIQIIENHMEDENLGVDLLAEKIGMSQSVLYKKLKALTAMSVNDFSKSIRLKRAAQLLKQKQYTIYEIGYMIGFSDRKYFSREFKKQFGKTPTDYAMDDDEHT